MAQHTPRRHSRRRFLGIAGLAGVAAAAGGAYVVSQRDEPDQATPEPARDAPPRSDLGLSFFQGDPPTFMTQLHGLHDDYWSDDRYESGPNTGRRKPEDMLPAHLDSLAELGVQGVRVDLGWSAVQPNPGEANWDEFHGYRFTELQRLLAERGMKMLLTVTRSPEWARPGTGTSDEAKDQFPTDLAAFTDFARQLAAKVDPNVVQGIECWNEPNIKAFTGLERGHAEAYVPVLNAFYDGVKAANDASKNPPIPVVFGGPSRNDVMFIEECLLRGPRFDVFAVNPYMADQSLDVTTPPVPGSR